jgi:hypothetical protein
MRQRFVAFQQSICTIESSQAYHITSQAMDPQQRLLLEVTYEGLENGLFPQYSGHWIALTPASRYTSSQNHGEPNILLRWVF